VDESAQPEQQRTSKGTEEVIAMHSTNQQIVCLNSLLRGELAATETYQQSLEKLDKNEDAEVVQSILDEHRDIAHTWKEHVRERGGMPAQTSGAWGFLARTVEGTAKLFGWKPALMALREGEERGIKFYEDALAGEGLPAECAEMVRASLLPQAHRHVRVLEQLIGHN
jgi:demethoxyubiquinone hydroxylase (CLK1/Coq7/Cat5 family)